MKSVVLSFCVLFFGFQASAQVVDLKSSVCGTTSGLNSKAYQFRYNGRTLVIASADYTLNAQNTCHQTYEGSLHLLKSDWAAGLALFENTASTSAPEIKWGTPKLMKKVMFAPGSKSGLIQANKSDRHEFGLQQDVLEISRLCLSPQVVGAPLFDYDDADQVMGFVSSQFIEIVPGGIARITRFRDHSWGGIDCENGPFIVLNAVNVKTWVDQVLSDTSGPALLSWDVPSQLQNIKKINWGPFSVTENCPTSVGGGVSDNYPIGGGDPFGIGGVNSSSLPCKFSVETNGSVNTITGPRASFAQEMLDLLKQNKTVEIYLGYKRVNGILVNRGFISIGDYIKKLLGDDLQFVLMVDGKKADSTLSPLQLQARRFRLTLQKYPFDSADHTFRNRGYLIALLLEGPQAQEVSRQDLEGLRQLSPWMEYDAMIDGLLGELDRMRP